MTACLTAANCELASNLSSVLIEVDCWTDRAANLDPSYRDVPGGPLVM